MYRNHMERRRESVMLDSGSYLVETNETVDGTFGLDGTNLCAKLVVSVWRIAECWGHGQWV